jgi:fluoroacetyl-CoA thioesterase
VPLEPGLTAGVTQTVTPAVTALAVGSGDVPVLATPALLALVERAAVMATAGRMPDGQTSVGASVSLEHLAATPLDVAVTATATLESVEGRRLTFSFEVRDPSGLVARGTHLRVVVDRARFVQEAESRAPG